MPPSSLALTSLLKPGLGLCLCKGQAQPGLWLPAGQRAAPTKAAGKVRLLPPSPGPHRRAVKHRLSCELPGTTVYLSAREVALWPGEQSPPGSGARSHFRKAAFWPGRRRARAWICIKRKRDSCCQLARGQPPRELRALHAGRKRTGGAEIRILGSGLGPPSVGDLLGQLQAESLMPTRQSWRGGGRAGWCDKSLGREPVAFSPGVCWGRPGAGGCPDRRTRTLEDRLWHPG